MNQVHSEFWILVTAKKRFSRWEVSGTPKASKRKPDKTRADQVAVKITVSIPETYFALPILSAKIELPDNAPGRAEILAAMEAKVAESAKADFGVSVTFDKEGERC